MPRYTVTATVTVNVEIELTAASKDDAKAALDKHLCMSASLIDFEGSDYDVCDDTISSIDAVTHSRSLTEPTSCPRTNGTLP